MHTTIPYHLYNITELVREPASMPWTNGERVIFAKTYPIQYERGKKNWQAAVQAIETMKPLPYSNVGTQSRF